VEAPRLGAADHAAQRSLRPPSRSASTPAAPARSATPALALIETANFKRRWYKPDYAEQERVALTKWLADRVEQAAKPRTQAFSLEQLVANLQDDARVLAVCEVLTGRKDFSLSQLVASALQGDAVPSHRFHVYKPAGLVKREAWERTWADQRREDAGETVTPEVPPAYGSGDFLKPEYWRCAASSTSRRSASSPSPRCPAAPASRRSTAGRAGPRSSA
jgi:hypothetical protein